ncbi:MAG: beta-lactamase family protein [Gemmatimonadaceae bacterium]|nr:beta-lactamase family protein [Gemmatimonadaceae bacterium]
MVLRSLTIATLLGASSLAAQAPSRAALVQRLDSIAGAPVAAGSVAGMAVAVVRGRDTLLLKGYGLADLENQVPATPQSVFRIGSVTKQFTAAAVMQLVEQGKVSLDDDMAKFLPRYPTRGKRITVRHLLNHTSGIPSYTDVGATFGAVIRSDLSHDSLVALIAPNALMFEPVSHFYYNNTGYYMLGMLIEQVTGKSYSDWLAAQMFAPLGLPGTTYCDTRKLIPRRAHGHDRGAQGLVNTSFISMDLPYAAGSLCSTVVDLVRWTDHLASGRVVSSASYGAMTSPVPLTSGRPMTYGFGLTVDTLGAHRVVSHGGGINGFISSLVHLPQDSLIIAVLANTSPAPADQVAMALARATLGLPPATPPGPPKDLAIAAADRAKFAGSYDLTRPDGTRNPVRIFEENGQLMIQSDGERAVRLMSQGGDVFIAPGVGRVAFDVAGARVTGFVLGGGARRLEAVRR